MKKIKDLNRINNSYNTLIRTLGGYTEDVSEMWSSILEGNDRETYVNAFYDKPRTILTVKQNHFIKMVKNGFVRTRLSI